MRKRLFPVCLAGLGALCLACCVSQPSLHKPLTVELFDSRVAAVAPPSTAAKAVPLPLPEIDDPFAASAIRLVGPTTLPTADSLVPGAARLAADVPVLSLPVVQQDAATGPATVVGLTVPSSPHPSAGYVLAQPIAPSAAPSTRVAAAPPPSVKKAAPAAAPRASSPTPAAAGSPAAATTANPATAAAPAPALDRNRAAPAASTASATSSGTGASPSAASGGSSADSYGRLREIYARVGDELQIGLDGSSFLFLGFPDSQAQGGGMSFKTKETRSGKTWFTFTALKLGTYDLDFLQQENATGTSTKETVRVHVVNDQDFTAAVGQQPAQDGSPPAETGDPAFADKLSSLGANEAAIVELQKGYKDGNPALNDQIAGLYARIGSWDAAGKYWQKNLALPGPYANAAVIGLVRVAAAQNDQGGLLAQLKKFLAINDPAAEEPMVQAIRMERAQNQVGVGLDLAAEYASRYPAGRWMDEVEFIAAQLLEEDSSFRDIARARELYRAIVATYPVGDFAAPARDRLQYIDRHFYQVR